MIQCVGARNEERKYCSRICCMTAIKNAIAIKEENPESSVHILYRDIQAYGTENEALLLVYKKYTYIVYILTFVLGRTEFNVVITCGPTHLFGS